MSGDQQMSLLLAFSLVLIRKYLISYLISSYLILSHLLIYIFIDSMSMLTYLKNRKIKISDHKDEYQFQGPITVWRENKYSILLPAGAMINKKFLWTEKIDKKSSDSLKAVVNVFKTNKVSVYRNHYTTFSP